MSGRVPAAGRDFRPICPSSSIAAQAASGNPSARVVSLGELTGLKTIVYWWSGWNIIASSVERATDGGTFGAGMGVLFWLTLGRYDQLISGAIFGAVVGAVIGALVGASSSTARRLRH